MKQNLIPLIDLTKMMRELPPICPGHNDYEVYKFYATASNELFQPLTRGEGAVNLNEAEISIITFVIYRDDQGRRYWALEL